MGFWVLCQCENCDAQESMEISGNRADGYYFTVESPKETDTIEFDSFEELAGYTDVGFSTTFTGDDFRDPFSHKLLCDTCQGKVRKVEKELEKSRQKKIRAALKGK